MDFHNERVRSGAAMALHDLRRILHHGGNAGEHISHNRHSYESGDWHADFHWVNIGVIAHNNAGFFHALNPLNNCWCSEAYTPAQLSVREPSIDLQLLQQLPANLIEQLVCS